MMLGDFDDALSDMTEDEDEMTQDEVRTCSHYNFLHKC
jgi:hypothetical protein